LVRRTGRALVNGLRDEIAGELGGHDAPILDYVRLRLQISERERAQSHASRLQRRKGRQRRAGGGATPRRHHHHHARPTRRPGRRAGRRPRRRRPAAARADRTPLGRDAFRRPTTPAPRSRWARLLLPKRVEHRNPRVRRDLASALRSAAAGLDVPSVKAKRSGPAEGARPSTPNWAGLHVNNCAGIPRTICRTAKPRPGWPSVTLRIGRDNEQIRQKIAAATNSLARTFESNRRAAHRARNSSTAKTVIPG